MKGRGSRRNPLGAKKWALIKDLKKFLIGLKTTL
jgi:hypothetical protein